MWERDSRGYTGRNYNADDVYKAKEIYKIDNGMFAACGEILIIPTDKPVKVTPKRRRLLITLR